MRQDGLAWAVHGPSLIGMLPRPADLPPVTIPHREYGGWVVAIVATLRVVDPFSRSDRAPAIRVGT